MITPTGITARSPTKPKSSDRPNCSESESDAVSSRSPANVRTPMPITSARHSQAMESSSDRQGDRPAFGAAAMGDIGRHFPDTDADFAGADSRVLLREAFSRVSEAGFAIMNVDSTVIAQAPKLAPFIEAIRANIAEDLELPLTRVNVKAKTNEKLGYLGRKEGIEAQAAVLLMRTGIDA